MIRPLILASALLLTAPLTAIAGGDKELGLDEFTKVVKRDDVGEVVQCSIRTYAPPPPTKSRPMMGMGMPGMARPSPPSVRRWS